MPLGILQNNSFVNMTLDLWNDKVFYQEREFPAGHFAASILNITDEELTELIRRGGAPTFYLPTVMQGRDEEVTLAFPVLRQQVLTLAEMLFRYPPFCYLDRERERERLIRLFSDSARPMIRVQGSEAQQEFLTLCAALTRVPLAIGNFIAAGKFFELDYLRRLRKRDETHFAVAAHDCFNSQEFWDDMQTLQHMDVELFSVSPELASSYVLARSSKSEKEMVFVNRVTFIRLVDFYTFDLLNGLHCGHAPSQCQNCGRYFLTTNGHMPKYCDGAAPQDSRMTCRQYGAMSHQKEQNKQHPVYRLFSTRTNTIRKHRQRGKISDALCQEALKVAAERRDRALMDNDYAADGYEQDMVLESVYEEAGKRL